MARTRTAPKKADEHAADPKEAAAAVDAKAKATDAVKDARGKQASTPRTDRTTIDRMLALRVEGLGVTAIAKRLEEEGIKTATGKTKWHGPAIRQILAREMGDEWEKSIAARKSSK